VDEQKSEEYFLSLSPERKRTINEREKKNRNQVRIKAKK
jgi:hypothetical protein